MRITDIERRIPKMGKRRLVRLERYYRFLADESADNLRSRYHRIHRKVWMELEDRESKK
jgi:hypothetical protein